MKSKATASQVYSLDGTKLYYWMTPGVKSQPTIVLHSGASMNHSSLESLEQKFIGEGYTTLLFDHRGVGYSDAPTQFGSYALDKFSNDLAVILSKEGIEKPAFIGHSLGFMVAVDYVVKTQNARGIAGICATPNFKDSAPSSVLFYLNKLFRYTENIGSLMTSIEHLVKGEKRTFNDQAKLDNSSDLAILHSIVDLPLRGIRANNVCGMEIDNWDIKDQLTRLKVPLVLVYGSKDIMVLEKAGDQISKLVNVPCDLRKVEGTHAIPITNYTSILEAIRFSNSIFG